MGTTAVALKTLALALIAGLFWLSVIRITGVAEPWDADHYWSFWYPVSLALSAAAGLVLARHGWLAGIVVTFMQFPVMGIDTGAGQMWIVALALLSLLAVPAIAISALAGWFAGCRQPA